MKKAILVLAIASLALFGGVSAAMANFGPHGGYSLDTDACAGCHRAHTSFSEVTWQDGTSGNSSSALLISSAKTMEEFCLACHGDQAPGASTNVEAGVFDAGPSGQVGVGIGNGILYQTNSSFDATLNGGAFAGSTSMHDMEKGAVTDPMWGDGSSAVAGTGITCTSCHDVHGSSNYRLLKDEVNGNVVGGYDSNDNPKPMVFSSEEGYPISAVGTDAVGGWLKHEPGAAQMADYRPNYTTAEYFYGGGNGTGHKSMSQWCSACHEAYDDTKSDYNYGAFESDGVASRDANGLLSVSGGSASLGMRTRHRHPVNTTVKTANTIAGFGTNAIASPDLPLEKSLQTLSDPRGTWTTDDFMGCLTCHRAHGSSAKMTGWANSRLKNIPSNIVSWTVEPTTSVLAGVNPNFTSALLRADNRGVCEGCHNK